MVLVFILCIIIAISLLTCMILLSTLKLEVKHLQVSNFIQNKEKLNDKYCIAISLSLFNKIRWLWMHLDSKRMNKLYRKMKLQKVDWKRIEQDISLDDLKRIKMLAPKISYLNLKTKVGLTDITITNVLVCILSIAISLGLPHLIEKYEKEKYYYEVVPVYMNRNVYEIKFDCIIEIKMVHIMNIIYYFLKKRREKNHEQRTSNRRAYGYSYE